MILVKTKVKKTRTCALVSHCYSVKERSVPFPLTSSKFCNDHNPEDV